MTTNAVNLAPVKPLYSMADSEAPTPTYICEGLKELFDDIMQRDKDTFDEVARTSNVVSNFIQGKQVFQLNAWTGQYVIRDLKHSNPNKITSINLMQFYTANQMQRIVSSNPDLEPADPFKRAQFRDAVKMSKAVWNHYEKKFYTPKFNNQEALSLIVTGNAFSMLEFDHLKQSAQAFREITEEVEVPISPGYGKCWSCEAEAEGSAFESEMGAQCPACGSMEVNYEPPVTEKAKSIAGLQPVDIGDFDLRLISILATKFNPKGSPEESTYFTEREVMPIAKLRYMYGQLNVSEVDYKEDKGLEALENLARAGNTLSGQQSYFQERKNSRDCIIDKVYLKPEEYAHITALKDEQTISGQTIPKGTKLRDACPDGMTIYGVNGLKHILGIFPGITHQERLSSATFHERYESGIGRGSEDTVEVQKRFNRFDSQMVRYGEATATPAYQYIEGAIDQKHVKRIGIPGEAIPIKRSAVSELGNADVIKTLAPGTPMAQTFQYTYDILNQYRQLTSLTTDFSNGLPGVDNSTATGARIAASNSASIWNPMLQRKAYARKDTAQKLLKLYPEFFEGTPRYFAFGATVQGQVAGAYIKGEQLDPDIDFIVVANSENPRGIYEKQQNLATVTQLLGGAQGIASLKQVMPELLDDMLKTWDVDLEINDYDMIGDICYQRVREALEGYAQFSQMMQSQGVGADVRLMPVEYLAMSIADFLSIPVEPFEANLAEKTTWLSEFLDSPEGIELDAGQRKIIGALIFLHGNSGAIQAGQMGQWGAQAEMMASEPSRARAKADMQEQIAQQTSREDALREEERASQAENAQRDMVKGEVDHARQVELTDLQNQREVVNA